MGQGTSARPLEAYVSTLTLGLVAVLFTAGFIADFSSPIWEWLALSVLFFFAEYADVNFHDKDARFGITVSEAIFLPMIAALTFSEVVIAVTVAIAFERLMRRLGLMKILFNVAQFSIAAAAGAFVWRILADGSGTWSLRNGAVALLGTFTFALLTHLFTSGVIALAERKSFLRLSRSVGPATLVNLAGSLGIGVLFASSYAAAPWTLILFPVALAGLHLGYRAVLRQSGERERVEHIHAATRALAASPDLGQALIGFLTSIADVVSAVEACAILRIRGQVLCSRVRSGEIVSVMEPVDSPQSELMLAVEESASPIIVTHDGSGSEVTMMREFGAQSMIAVPIVDEQTVVGCIFVLDRIGPDDFGDADVRLLEALGNEVVVTLDSYRLFSEITEERERFQRIFQGSKEGICLVDPQGIVKAWNPALEKITGYSEAEMIGQRCLDKVLVRDRAQRRVEMEDIIEAAPEDEFELVTKQGPPRWISVLSGSAESAGERGWVVLVRDRTAEHAAEEAKSDFLATISHELRTPLTTIKGSLQVLGRDPSRLPPDTAEQMIEVLRRGADRLERLVLNLLFVSQVESGGVKLISDEIALTELIAEVLRRVPEDPTRVRVSMRDEDAIVRGDREKLAQALEHLLDNAQKYGGETATIDIEVAREGGYARVSVTDRGPGIPKADQERIFERFVRLGNILTRETQGAGVGLFIARRSIEGMGGSIWVESEGSKGATFHVRIPLAHLVSVSDEATGA